MGAQKNLGINMKRKKVLICGANGFIGKNLLERLYQKDLYDIRGTYFRSKIDENYDIDWCHADLRNSQDVKRALKGIDIVFQYAATTSGIKDVVEKPHMHVADNAIMNSILFRDAVDLGVEHFIFPSCSIMYQSSNDLIKEDQIGENSTINSKYYGSGNTKLYLEKMCKFYSSFNKTRFTIMRQSNIYGPYDKFDLDRGHVFAATIVKVMKENREVIVWGTGEEERDLLHVSDLLNFIETCIEKQKSYFELVNVGVGGSISIKDLVIKIVNASEKDLEIQYDQTKPTVKTRLALDISRAKNLFGWAPEVSLDDGIKKTISWYNKNRSDKNGIQAH